MNSNYEIYDNSFKEVTKDDASRLDGYMYSKFGNEWQDKKEEARKFLEEAVKEETSHEQ